jgi:flagellin-like hook-associated protein FlgL
MKSWLILSSAVILSTLLAACGGTGSNNNGNPPPPPPPPAVTVSLTEAAITMDTSPDLTVPNTHTFTAVVQHASNGAVTWKVNGIPGGDTLTGHGTITTAGIYTAPVFIPSDAITITAASSEDPTKTASATVKLNWYVSSISAWTSGNAAQVKTSEQLQVSASVGTYGPQTVTWDINGVKTGSPTLGALLFYQTWPNAAFYTAPPTSPGTVTVRATSDANPTKSASVQIAVVPSDPNDPTVSVTPAEVSLQPGKTSQFSASTTNSIAQPFWTVTQGTSKLVNGFVNDSGFYTAPFEVPPASDVVVTASVNGYSSKYAYAIVHLTPPAVNPNTRVNGSYVISLHDQRSSTNLLGIVTADGKGSLQGSVDVNTPLGVATAQAFNGTYSLGPDGRGSATISYTPLPGMTFTMGVRLMMVSDDLTYLYSNDNYLGASIGVMEKQSSDSFSSTSLSGSYAFLLKGMSLVPNLQPPPQNVTQLSATAGVLTADGAGHLTGAADTSAAGILTQQTVTGTYSVQTHGAAHATLTLATNTQQITSQVSIAMVSPSKLYLLTTDDITLPTATAPLLAGVAERQSGTFSNASLSGPYVAYDQGEQWLQFLRFDANGSGTFSNGFTHERDTSGTTSPLSSGPFLGGYTVESNGRVWVTVNAYNGTGYCFMYMVSPQKFFLLVNDAYPATGEGFLQDASGFNWSQIAGRYAVRINGGTSDGVGWILPHPSTSWLGWMDNVSNLRIEPAFDFNPLDMYGTGTASISEYGAELTVGRFYVVSESKVLMMSASPTASANVLMTLQKIEP